MAADRKSDLPQLAEWASLALGAPRAAMDGSQGANRNRRLARRQQIPARNDAEAIDSWLAGLDNANTRRAYRREAQRLLAWCVAIRQLPMSSLGVEDLRAYMDWLAAPELPPGWPARWRLINGPLKLSSRRQSKVILQALFDYLVDAAYLEANPFRLLGKKQRGRDLAVAGEGFGGEGEVALPRWLEPELWRWLLGRLEALPQATAQQLARAERLRFLVIWLYRTAARRSELANGRMAHIHYQHGLWLWRIAGKGGSVADVPLDAEVLAALLRYRRFRGLPDYPLANETSVPIAAALDGRTTIRDLQIYSALKWFFARASQEAESLNPGWAAKLSMASAHWLRHSLASHAARAGVPIQLTAERLRHRSQATTQKFYVHVSLQDQLRAFAGDLAGAKDEGDTP